MRLKSNEGRNWKCHQRIRVETDQWERFSHMTEGLICFVYFRDFPGGSDSK